jgi:hypothetical protein
MLSSAKSGNIANSRFLIVGNRHCIAMFDPVNRDGLDCAVQRSIL